MHISSRRCTFNVSLPLQRHTLRVCPCYNSLKGSCSQSIPIYSILLLTHYGLFICQLGDKLIKMKHLLSRLWSNQALPPVVISKATRRTQFLAAILIALICPKKCFLLKLPVLSRLFPTKSTALISINSA